MRDSQDHIGLTVYPRVCGGTIDDITDNAA